MSVPAPLSRSSVLLFWVLSKLGLSCFRDEDNKENYPDARALLEEPAPPAAAAACRAARAGGRRAATQHGQLQVPEAQDPAQGGERVEPRRKPGSGALPPQVFAKWVPLPRGHRSGSQCERVLLQEVVSDLDPVRAHTSGPGTQGWHSQHRVLSRLVI